MFGAGDFPDTTEWKDRRWGKKRELAPECDLLQYRLSGRVPPLGSVEPPDDSCHFSDTFSSVF